MGSRALLVALAACGSSNGVDGPTADAPTDTAVVDPSAIAVAVVPYASGSGVYFQVPITIDGGPPVTVLVDTASSGLRVFASALDDPSLVVTAENAMFFRGNGDAMIGHTAMATVGIGNFVTAQPIAFQLVESFSCHDTPTCDLASGSPSAYTDSGIFGILGVSLQEGFMLDTYSPFAQLADGFTFHTGGFGSTTAAITLGALDADDPTAIVENFSHDLPNGKPGWQSGRLGCFKIEALSTEAACLTIVLDSGSADDYTHFTSLPAGSVVNGAIAPGPTVSVLVGPSDVGYTVATATSSQDRLVVDGARGNVLGIELFLRYDITFDIIHGKIGLHPHP